MIGQDVWGDNQGAGNPDNSDDPNYLKSSNPLVPNPNDPGNFYTNQTRMYDAADPKQMYFEFNEHLFDYSYI